MTGASYLILTLLPFLVISGIVGFLIGWFAHRIRSGSGEMQTAIDRYQRAEKARQALETENEDMRLRLANHAPTEDASLKAELETLRQQSADQRDASRALSESLEEAQSRLAQAQAEWNAERSEIEARVGSVQNSDRERELENQVANLRAQLQEADQSTVGDSMRAEMESLRSDASETNSLRERLAELSSDHERLERELIQARNAISASPKDDDEKQSLRQQLERLQREMIALKMEAEVSADPGEVIALKAMNSDKDSEIAELRELLRGRDVDLERAITEASNFRIAAQEVPELRAQLASANKTDEIEQLRSDLESSRNAASQQVHSLKEERDQLQAAIADLRVERTSLAAAKEQLERVAFERDDLARRLEAAPNPDEFAALRTQFEEMAERLDAAPQPQAMSALRAENEELMNRVEAITRSLAERDASLAQAIPATVSDELSAQIGALEAERNALSQRLEKAESMAVEQTTIIANLETELSARPEASETIFAAPAETAHFEAQISALERALGAVHIEKIRLEDELLKFREAPAFQSPTVIEPDTTPLFTTEEEPDPMPELVNEPELIEEIEMAVEPPPVPIAEPTVKQAEPFLDDLDEGDLFADEDEPLAQAPSTGFNVVQSAPDAVAEDVVRKVERDLTPEEPKKKRAAPNLGNEGPDDLEEIIGIGPVARRTLVERGIDTYEKIAHLSPNQIDVLSGLIENFRDRLVREKWREQAKVLYRLKYGREI